MKSTILNNIKSFLLITAFSSFLTLTGCNLINTPETNSDTDEAYITFNVDRSRTIFPDLDVDNFSNFVLTGTFEGGDPQIIGSWSSISSARATLQTGTWNFVLTAKNGSAEVQGVLLNKAIVNGENTLNFTMKAMNNGNATSYGSIEITVSVPSTVTYITAGLFDIETGKEDSECKLESIELDNGKATYRKSFVKTGSYLAKFFMYSDSDGTVLLNEYSEVIVVASEAVSQGSREILTVNTPYSITYDYGAGALKEGATANSSYSILTTALLPTADDLEYDNHIFAGWYETSDFSGGVVTSIPAGTTYGNKTYYARWAVQGNRILNVITAAKEISDLESNGAYTIKITGYSDDLINYIGSIANVIKEKTDIIIYLDLSELNLTKLADNQFKDCTALQSIILPTSITEIGASAFAGCSNLVEMTIPFVGKTKNPTTAAYTTLFGYLFGNTTYKNAVAVTQTYGTNYNYYIPASLRKVTVLGGKIMYGAFSACNMLTDIVVPSTLTEMGIKAFYNCSGLTSFTIPSGLAEIGSYQFSGCSSITEIEIPNTVTKIGTYAFEKCTGLTGIDITNTQITEISDRAFYECSALKVVSLNNGVLNKLGYYAFYKCISITDFVVPSTVTTIGTSCFGGCSELINLTLPFIGNTANKYSSRTSDSLFGYIFGSSSNTGCTAVSQSYYSSGSSVSITYYIPSKLTNLTITGAPADKETVHSYSFINCTVVPNVIYMGGEIAASAFAGYKGLKTFENRTTKIKAVNYMFYYDSNLTTVIFPEDSTCKTLPSYIFNGCTSLVNFEIPSSVTVIDTYAFYNCTSLPKVNLPNGLEKINANAFSNCSAISKLVIPDSVTDISDGAFRGCTGLTEITIPFTGNKASATTVSSSTCFGTIFGSTTYTGGVACVQKYGASSATFYIPSSLTKVTLTGTKLFTGAFAGCTPLKTIVIPDEITEIPSYCFYSCSGLTSSPIKAGVTSLGTYSMYGCSGLAQFTIPAAVTTLEPYVLANCTGLTEITFPNNLISLKEGALSGCTVLATVNFGTGLTEIGASAFMGCAGLETLTLPNTITTIGATAFKNCVGIKNAVIPQSTLTIGSGAFNGCSGLTNITIPFVGNSASATTAGSSTLFGYIFGSSFTGGTSVSQYYSSSSYTSYYIPTNLKTVTVTGGNIYYGAFYGCTMLDKVEVGSAVATIGTKAFYNVNKVHYHGTATGTPWGAKNVNATVIAIDTPSTCSVHGTGHSVCSDCGATTESNIELPFATHSFGDGDTCTACGKQIVSSIWENIENGAYKFTEDAATHKWTSSNKGKASTSATSSWQIEIYKEVECSIPYSVSSEINYDKLTIWVDGVAKVSGISGISSGTIKVTLSPGNHVVKAQYTKDSSRDNSSDCGTITLIPVEYGVQE